jgi:hypothetical protein
MRLRRSWNAVAWPRGRAQFGSSVGYHGMGHGTQIALALDASALGVRFVVLAVSVA